MDSVCQCLVFLNIFNDGFVSPALAGKTHRDHFVPCCCLLMSVVVCCEKGLTFGSIVHML